MDDKEKVVKEKSGMTLTEYLLQNSDVSNITAEVNVSKRFNDAGFKFEIRAMTQDEFGSYQKAATKLDAKGKKTEFDNARFNAMMIENHCINPDFKSSDFLKKLGVATPRQAINKVLLAGEVIELGSKITELSGFDNDLNDEVEEAKN